MQCSKQQSICQTRHWLFCSTKMFRLHFFLHLVHIRYLRIGFGLLFYTNISTSQLVVRWVVHYPDKDIISQIAYSPTNTYILSMRHASVRTWPEIATVPCPLSALYAVCTGPNRPLPPPISIKSHKSLDFDRLQFCAAVCRVHNLSTINIQLKSLSWPFGPVCTAGCIHKYRYNSSMRKRSN